MPIIPVPQPTFANVPIANGVPIVSSPLLSGIEEFGSADLASLLSSIQSSALNQQWGIYDDNNQPVLVSSHVEAVEIAASYGISDAPIENGGFLSFNKVKVPRAIRVEVLCDGSGGWADSQLSAISNVTSMFSNVLGGTQTSKNSFMVALENALYSLDVYHVTTPEIIYPNMNVINYRIRRASDRGATMIMAEVDLHEVRLMPSSQSAPSQSPSGNAQINSGNVQATPLSSAKSVLMGAIL